MDVQYIDNVHLDTNVSAFEVIKYIEKPKLWKAYGIDCISTEGLDSDASWIVLVF